MIGPSDGKWHVQPELIDVGLGPRERHAVVSGHRDYRILQLTAFFQLLDHSPEMRVEPLDLEGIVEQVAAHDLGIREKRGDDNIFEAVSHFVSPVRRLGAIPETEGSSRD